MKNLALVVFMHLVVAENVQNQTNKTVLISTTDGNFFKKINLNLHNATDALFNSLKFDKNYTENTKMKLLNLIHESITNVSESNCKSFWEIQNITLSDCHSKTDDALFNLTTIIDEIFNVLQFDNEPDAEAIYLDIVVNEFESTRALLRTVQFVENDTKSEGMIEMMKFFIEGTGNNFTQPMVQGPDIKILKKRKRPRQYKSKKIDRVDGKLYRKLFYNLKPWRPQSDSIEVPFNLANRRIYKGKKTKIRKYPFITSVHVMGEFMCAGSIISRNLIITSASCLHIAYNNPHLIENPDIITIRAGTELTNKGGVVLQVIEIHFHPNYDSLYMTNNLAIARIETELAFRNNERQIRRIEYDKQRGKLPEIGTITILGWGDKNSYTRYTGPLTMAYLEVYGLEPCKEVYSENYVQDTNFCAGFVTVGGGACNKDLGGPGIMGGQLVGIVSFGPPVCGTADAPTVFTKLGFYADWIDKVIKKVQRTPNKKPSEITFRQTSDTEIKLKDQPIQKIQRPFSPDVLTLKRLYKEYVVSGRMDLKDLTQDDEPDIQLKTKHLESEHSTNKSTIINTEVQNEDKSTEENKPKIDFNKVKSLNNNISTEHYNDDSYVIDELDMSSMDDDGESKSNSLSDNYEINKNSYGSDEEMESGLSIEMETTAISPSSITTMNSNNIENREAYAPIIGPPKKIQDRSGLGIQNNKVNTTVSKIYRFKQMNRQDPESINQFEVTQNFQFNVDNIVLQRAFVPKEPRITPGPSFIMTPVNLRRDLRPEDNVSISIEDTEPEYTEITPDQEYYYTEKYMNE